jgi:hypothetical protein
VDFDCRKSHGFERIEYGYTGVGIGCGVNDNGIVLFVSLLYAIYDGAFAVGLEKVGL